MNHPTQEEWVPYLYGEVQPQSRLRLKQHLQDCPECRARIQLWQRNLGRLDLWRLPPKAQPARISAPLLKWAAAAVLVLAMGIGIGRSMAPGVNLNRVRAALEPEIRQKLRQEFRELVRQELETASSQTLARAGDQARTLVADASVSLENKRVEENQAIYAALDTLFFSLKKDVDTVAVNTDQTLRRLAVAELAPDVNPPQP